MNVPFKFTMATTNHVFALWNPFAVTTGINGNNEALDAIPDPLAVGIAPPLGPFVITSIVAMTDADGDAAISVGYYDTVLTVFVPLYHILATAVAGGGVVDTTLGDGVFVPVSATKVPAVRYDGAAGGIVSGYVRIHFVPDVTAAQDVAGGPTQPLFDEDSAVLLDEFNQIIYQS